MKRKIAVGSVLLILALYLSACGFQEAKTLLLPKSDKIEKMELSLHYKDVMVNKIAINSSPVEFVESLIRDARPTRRKSVNEQPTNVDRHISIQLFHSEDLNNPVVIHLYANNGDYYLEQPYQGIWKVSEKLYQDITDRFRE